ncbi:MAG: phage tail assembly chaperone [Deltaproteobacteria bacterium]|nr:phage tail assembly chaperone [Deltaproteobacteria bacterium]
MTIYHYHPTTGEYLGKELADESPLEPGIFLLPAHATAAPPPQPSADEVVVFLGGAWQVVPDYRGTSWWRQDGSMYTIETLGVLPADTDIDHDPRPSPYHDWSGSAWILNRETWLDTEVRTKRDQLLTEIDVIYCNADRWELMTSEQKQEWRAYKQALRDLPTTINPSEPAWPIPPSEVRSSSDTRVSVIKQQSDTTVIKEKIAELV